MAKSKRYKQYLAQAGFIDITEKIYAIPGSPWPRDKKMKEQGAWMGQMVWLAVDSYKMFLLYAGLTKIEIDDLSTRVKAEIQNVRIHWFLLL